MKENVVMQLPDWDFGKWFLEEDDKNERLRFDVITSKSFCEMISGRRE